MKFNFRTGDTHKPHIKRMIAARERAIAAGMRLLTEDEILGEAREQGRIIGRREMKPLVRELMNAIQDMDVERKYGGGSAINIQDLINRAKEALEND